MTSALRLDPGTGRIARTALVVLLLAAVAVFHVWSRTQVVAAGYALGELQRDHVTLTSEHDRLRIEVETLRSPAVLERVARTRLGMAPPAPGAVSAAGPQVAEAGEGGQGVVGAKHRPGPAEPSRSSGRRRRAAAGPAADPGGAVAFRGPLRAGRAAPTGR
ncbi:MAG TPA: cell division protein FtsL [Anaeromyxobacter sp.]